MSRELKPAGGLPANTGQIGLWLGSLAVLFWSFGSALIYLGAREAGTWRFVAIAAMTSGLLQLISRRLYHGELATALLLPWRLWAGPLLCFVLYGLAWPCALASATPREAGAVNLINYLWPVLTVVFSIGLVPGLRWTKATAMSVGLATAGLLCANAQPVRALFLSGIGHSPAQRSLPFLLGAVAAVTWALYSAMLSRWKAWARNYVTSPLGFIIVGLIASLVLTTQSSHPGRLSRAGLTMTLLYGAGPLGAGYLLWELALARAKVQSLSILAAATPVLSTIVLAGCLRAVPGLDVVLAALLISGGIVLSLKSPARPLKANSAGDPEDTDNPQRPPKGFQDRAPGTF